MLNDFIDSLLENPMDRDALLMPEGDTGLLFKTEEEKVSWRRERDKALEELEGLLYRIEPSSTGKGKQLKLELLDKVFGTTSMTAIGELRPEEIMVGYKKLGLEAVAMGVAEIIEIDGRQRLVAKSQNGNGNGETEESAKKPKPEKKNKTAKTKK